MTTSLDMLTTFLDKVLVVERFVNGTNGTYIRGQRMIQRIGLALEPWPAIGDWAREEHLDALFLHRPWKLDPTTLPEDVSVLAYHEAFDAELTLGMNRRLADALGIGVPVAFGSQNGVALGMLGDITPITYFEMMETLEDIFASDIPPPDKQGEYRRTISFVAVVNAMNDELIRKAARQGAELYITGQYRPSAANAVRETCILVAALGHGSIEHWGLRALGHMLRERWHDLDVVVNQAHHVSDASPT